MVKNQISLIFELCVRHDEELLDQSFFPEIDIKIVKLSDIKR